jgi:selenocysteine lyase/cysteine desulfurase
LGFRAGLREIGARLEPDAGILLQLLRVLSQIHENLRDLAEQETAILSFTADHASSEMIAHVTENVGISFKTGHSSSILIVPSHDLK